MTTRSESDLEVSWARGQLGLSEASSPRQVRSAFLTRLADADFCPLPAVDYAYRVLAELSDTETTNLGWQQAQVDIETGLRGEIDGFAGNFFSLSVATRERRWQEYKDRCAEFPALEVRLSGLQPALDLDAEALSGPCVQLARMLCELAGLPAGPRARRRRELLDELQEEMSFWDSTAQELQRRHSRFARLDPVFLSALLGHKLHAQRARKAEKARAQAPPASVTSGGQGSGAVWYIVLFVVIVILRVATMSSNTPAPRQNPPNRFQDPRPPFDPELLKNLQNKKWRVEDLPEFKDKARPPWLRGKQLVPAPDDNERPPLPEKK